MIVDTGILYALADRGDKHHAAAKRIFRLPEPKMVPDPVVVETDYLISSKLGADAKIAFLESLGERAFVVEVPTPEDRVRAAAVAARYRDLRLGYVDAVIVAMAERLRETRLATVGRKHFGAIRPAHTDAFELLP